MPPSQGSRPIVADRPVAPRRRRVIPVRSRIERDLPIESLVPLAIREGNRKKPIYEVHKWWARRLGSNFRMLLLSALLPAGITDKKLWKAFYSAHRRRGLVVLDPFMGGGTSIVEATKLGARTVGNDIDPVAWFVTKKEIEGLDNVTLRTEFDRIEKAIGATLRAYYKHVTEDGQVLDVTTFFWVMVVKCPRCARRIDAHPHYQLHRDPRSKQQTVFCRHCEAVSRLSYRRRTLSCAECGKTTDVRSGPVAGGRFTCACGQEGPIGELADRGRPLATRLFALEYETVEGKRVFAKATDRDRETYQVAKRQLQRSRRDVPFPKDAIPTEQRYDDRPLTYGFARYHQLFNARQLLCLATLFKEVLAVRDEQLREYLILAFSDALGSNNMLCSYAFGYRKLSPLFGLHAYRVVTRPVEGNVWGCRFGRGSFAKCFDKLLRGKAYCRKPYEVIGNGRDKCYTGESCAATTTLLAREWEAGKAQALLLNTDSVRLDALRAQSVDLILTDPPYYNNLPYSELSDFYYVWLKAALPQSEFRWSHSHAPYRDGLLVRRKTLAEHQKFAKGMGSVFKECSRVLRADGIMVFTYHHSDWRAWIVLGEALAAAEFRITNVLPLLAEGRSGFHSDDGNIKWDAVVVCRPSSQRRGPEGPSVAEVVRLARDRCRSWKARLAQSARKPGAADMASLAYAFGLWALLRGKPSQAIQSGIEAISVKVNRERRPYGLFRPASSARLSKSTASAVIGGRRTGAR